MSFLKFGGSWKRSGPSFEPRPAAVSQKWASGLSTNLSRESCVMRFGAFNTNVNSGGVASAQPATVLAFGIR